MTAPLGGQAIQTPIGIQMTSAHQTKTKQEHPVSIKVNKSQNKQHKQETNKVKNQISKKTMRLKDQEQVQLAYKHHAANKSTGKGHNNEKNEKQRHANACATVRPTLASIKLQITTTQTQTLAAHQMLPSFIAVSVPN